MSLGFNAGISPGPRLTPKDFVASQLRGGLDLTPTGLAPVSLVQLCWTHQRPLHPSRCGATYDETNDQIIHTDPTAGVVSILKFSGERKCRNKIYKVYRDAAQTKSLWFTLNPGVELRQDLEMRAKMKTPEGRQRYALRQSTVEPVFGHIKSQYGLKRSSLRGMNGANIEFLLGCTIHNIFKLVKSRANNRDLIRHFQQLWVVMVGLRWLAQPRKAIAQ